MMGLGVVDSAGGDLSHAYSTVLVAKRQAPLPERLYHLFEETSRVIRDWQPAEVAIEQPFTGENKRASLAIGQAQAVAMVAAAQHGLPVSSYAPRQVKRAVTDHGGSSKEQVQEMVRLLLGLDTLPEPSDVADALAVAICHINANQVPTLAQ